MGGAHVINPEPEAVTLEEMVRELHVDEAKLTPEFRAWLERRRVTKVTYPS